MLSIDFLSHGHANYYASLATTSGDYFTEGGQPPGFWWGTFAKSLGLRKKVSKDQLRAIFKGCIRKDGKNVPLVQKQRKKKNKHQSHRPGTGLCFSDPKSVSVFYAMSDEKTRKKMDDIRRRGLDVVIKYIQEHLAYTRRGHGGKVHEKANLLAAVFDHLENRKLEPQLHFHVLLMNVCKRTDGTMGTVVNDFILTHKKLLGAIYRAEVASLLQEEMNLRTKRDRDYYEIEGVHQEICDRFSTPRLHIEAEMKRRGISGAKAAEMLNLMLRKRKNSSISHEKLLAEWNDTINHMGYDASDLKGCFEKREIDEEQQWQEAAAEAIELLTYHEPSFTLTAFRYQLTVCTQGRGLSVANLEARVSEFMGDAQAALRLKKKRKQLESDIIALDDECTRFTTRSVLNDGLDIFRLTDALANSARDPVSESVINRTINDYKFDCLAKGFMATPEKLKALESIVRNPSQICLINGKAGAAKTSTTKPAIDAYKREGYQVFGAAPTAAAAEILAKETGIEASTLHTLLGILPGETKEEREAREAATQNPTREHVSGGRFATSQPADLEKKNPAWKRSLDKNCIVFVDEVSMVSEPLMKETLQRMYDTGARVVFLGDRGQKKPVERGAAFSAMLSRVPHVSLNEIVRQDEDWARQMATHASEGEFGKALELLAEHKCISVAKTRKALMLDVVVQWDIGRHKEPTSDHLIQAVSNAEVDFLNDRCQQLNQELDQDANRKAVPIRHGKLHYGRSTESVYVGDPVVFTRNKTIAKGTSQECRVQNGYRGTVTKIHQDGSIRIKLPKRSVTVQPENFPHLRLGYAATSAKAQGGTFDYTYCVPAEHCHSADDFYTQVTRFKKGMHLFLDEATLSGKLETIAKSKLVKRLETEVNHELAIETLLRGGIDPKQVEKLPAHLKEQLEKDQQRQLQMLQDEKAANEPPRPPVKTISNKPAEIELHLLAEPVLPEPDLGTQHLDAKTLTDNFIASLVTPATLEVEQDSATDTGLVDIQQLAQSHSEPPNLDSLLDSDSEIEKLVVRATLEKEAATSKPLVELDKLADGKAITRVHYRDPLAFLRPDFSKLGEKKKRLRQARKRLKAISSLEVFSVPDETKPPQETEHLTRLEKIKATKVLTAPLPEQKTTTRAPQPRKDNNSHGNHLEQETKRLENIQAAKVLTVPAPSAKPTEAVAALVNDSPKPVFSPVSKPTETFTQTPEPESKATVNYVRAAEPAFKPQPTYAPPQPKPAEQSITPAKRPRPTPKPKKRNPPPSSPPASPPMAMEHAEAIELSGGMLTFEAIQTGQLAARTMLKDFAEKLYSKTAKTGRLLFREIARPASQLAWKAVCFPNELWEKFQRAEKKRLKEMHEDAWQQQDGKKSKLQAIGGLFKNLVTNEQELPAAGKPHEVPLHETGSRFLNFLINEAFAGTRNAAKPLWGLMNNLLRSTEVLNESNCLTPNLRSELKQLSKSFGQRSFLRNALVATGTGALVAAAAPVAAAYYGGKAAIAVANAPFAFAEAREKKRELKWELELKHAQAEYDLISNKLERRAFQQRHKYIDEKGILRCMTLSEKYDINLRLKPGNSAYDAERDEPSDDDYVSWGASHAYDDDDPPSSSSSSSSNWASSPSSTSSYNSVYDNNNSHLQRAQQEEQYRAQQEAQQRAQQEEQYRAQQQAQQEAQYRAQQEAQQQRAQQEEAQRQAAHSAWHQQQQAQQQAYVYKAF